MKEPPQFGTVDLLCLLLVTGLAGGLRAGYLVYCVDNGHSTPSLVVQTHGATANEARQIALRLQETGQFESRAPFADKDEPTAHLAPGYPYLLGYLALYVSDPDMVLRWVQVVLGTLTVTCYFFFARRAFDSNLVGTLAGLMGAVHPFWIANGAEIADGSLATFLLALCLATGARAGAEGGPFTSLLFGLTLAGLALVRAALLPFTLVALLAFLWQCRVFRWGWFAGLLAFLGYANGLAPWTVRNWQVFGEPLPIVSSAYLHLWIGNHAGADGALPDEEKLRQALPPDVLKELLDEPNQARRYSRLGLETWKEASTQPGNAVGRRLNAGLMFFFGESWFRSARLGVRATGTEIAASPEWLADHSELILATSLLLLFPLAFFGWRWSVEWAPATRLATLALLLIPLPYVLGHAENLSGPRLPLDGVLIVFAALALAYLLTGNAWTGDEKSVPPAEPLP